MRIRPAIAPDTPPMMAFFWGCSFASRLADGLWFVATADVGDVVDVFIDEAELNPLTEPRVTISGSVPRPSSFTSEVVGEGVVSIDIDDERLLLTSKSLPLIDALVGA